MGDTIKEIYFDYLKYLALKNKITTIKTIEYKFKNYILPYFGEYKTNELTKNMYIDFLTIINNLHYSEQFNEQINTICKNFFKYLNLFYNIEDITVDINFNKRNYIYKSNQTKGTFSKKEFKKFIKCVDNNIYHALFNVLFYCGLRKGEILALKVSDYKNGYLKINKTITKELFNGKRQILTTKTKKSDRVIKLDFFTNIEIKRLIKYYNTNYADYNEDFFLFGARKPISCTTLERKKNEYCKLAKVKQIRIHDFRHSHATILYNNNVKVKAIQSRLGHSNISTTLDTYIHDDKLQEKRLINKINLIRL